MNKTDFFNNMPPRVISESENEIIMIMLSLLDIRPDSRVLDVGCGAAALTPRLTLLTGRHNITAVDISPNMIALARAKFGEVNFMECDFMKHRFGPVRFDVVLSYNAFPHFGAPDRAFAKMAELVAPDGKIAVMHSMGRVALNRMHAAKPAVADDILPPLETFRAFARDTGLKPATAIDGPRMFMFAAQKTKD